MRRRLPNLVTALSLLLCAAVCGLWVRSHWVCDSVVWNRVADGSERRQVTVANLAGGLQVEAYRLWSRSGTLPGPFPTFLHYQSYPVTRVQWTSETTQQSLAVDWIVCGLVELPATPLWAAPAPTLRFETVRDPEFTNTWRGVVLVLTPLLLVTAVPLLRARVIRRSRLRAGACARCGYDLRATPGRCPECGTTRKPDPALSGV